MIATIIRDNERFSITEEMREALGLEAGAVVVVERQGESIILRAANVAERTAGSLHVYALYPVPTDEELDDVIAEAWAEDEMPDDPLRTVDRLYGSLGRHMTRPSLSAAEEREAFESGVAAEVSAEGLEER